MDQEKTGRFIAGCRKDKQLTQAGLAEKLGITDRAVSKWETGKCLPDASIMLELCGLLGITVNELLTGEHIIMTDYREIAEKNLVELKKQEEQSNRKLLSAETFLTSAALLSSVALAVTGALIAKTYRAAGIAVCALGIIIALVTAVYAVSLERSAGYYECPHCGKRYVPTFKDVLLAPHIGRSRKLTCPNCGRRGYHKKVLTK